MAKFSRRSLNRLRTATQTLQDLFMEIVKEFDCTIVEGHRGKEAQNRAFAEGRSKLQWPDGNHNDYPSTAVDAGPYDPKVRGVNWDTKIIANEHRDKIRQPALRNLLRFYYFGGFVVGFAIAKGIRLRWGGDWDGDRRLDDQTFDDLVHFEEKPQ